MSNIGWHRIGMAANKVSSSSTVKQEVVKLIGKQTRKLQMLCRQILSLVLRLSTYHECGQEENWVWQKRA